MVAYENPKTLRHMCNRLRRLGYVVRSTKWSSGQSAWQINLDSGQTLYLHDRGKVTLGLFQRDRELKSYSTFRGRRIKSLPPCLHRLEFSTQAGMDENHDSGRPAVA